MNRASVFLVALLLAWPAPQPGVAAEDGFVDPWEDVFRESVAALDQSCDRWNERPTEKLNVHVFVANFIASISHGQKRFVTGRMVQLADRDSDGLFDRDEATVFLRQQLGLLCGEVDLRQADGRQLIYYDFLRADADRRGWLSIGEYADRSLFAKDDVDGNLLVTLAEYSDLASPASGQRHFDLAGFFGRADRNQDGRLDTTELRAATSDDRKHLVDSTFSAFDQDHDGNLTMSEYALSMHASRNYFWHVRPVDRNGDELLEFEEFVFHEVDQFQLQRFYFFHRLDRNGDDRLSLDEFDFRLQP